VASQTPPPKGKHWQYPPSRLDQLDAAGGICRSSNGNPRRKVYFNRSAGIPEQDIWMDFKDAHNQNIHITGYPTEKNFGLLSPLIEATGNNGELVLDCHCGSGTSLEAAGALGRRFISIDDSEAAIATTVNRLRDGRSAMGDFVGVRGTPETEPQGEMLFTLDGAPSKG